MRNTKNAFTLVELIVVITILAILGTIAFISLQGYSADARNSKRTSDIGNIQSAISLKMVEGVPLMSFIINDANNAMTDIALAWSGWTDATYDAGTPSYTVLNVAEKDFKDPQGDNEYRIGGTLAQNGVFQIAATMEVDGTDTAQVNGTFIPRDTAAKGTSSSAVSVDGTTITLDDADANMFKAGDYIEDTVPTSAKVLKVSRDGVTLTLDTAITATVVNLVEVESAGLIGASNTVANVITNLDTTDLPY